ncbi:MAG TPA: SDR family oxidoreductase [Armatimonadota bacterium]|nr:SDR family oxidoreductase [Armatimonadota bacterium]
MKDESKTPDNSFHGPGARRSFLGPAAAGVVGFLAARALAGRRTTSFRDRVVVITGGSRGLGLVLAREFAGEGARLALLARDEDELERARQELAAGGAAVLAIPCDVSRQADVDAAVDSILEEFGAVDVLVNNAGLIQVGPLEQMRLEDFENTMAVHFWGPLYAILRVIPQMRERGGGRIVNISSIGGLVAIPHLAPYCASKFALVGLSDGLRTELAPYGIQVTTVCPGLMRTGSHLNALFKGQHEEEFAWFSVSGALPVSSVDARSAARQILAACRRGAPRLVITVQAKALVLGASLFPGMTARAMALLNRILPGPTADRGEIVKTGWESRSRRAPSVLTHLADRAAERNNEGTLE